MSTHPNLRFADKVGAVARRNMMQVVKHNPPAMALRIRDGTLGVYPTPLQRVDALCHYGVEFWIKRDDLGGIIL